MTRTSPAPTSAGVQRRRRLWRWTPTGRVLLAGLAATWIAGWLAGGTTGLLSACLSGLFLLSLLLTRLHLSGIELSLPHREESPIGDPLLLRLQVRNRARWFALHDVVIARGHGLGDDPRPIGALKRLGPGQSCEIPLDYRLLERGVIRHVPLVAFSSFPFGLLRFGFATSVPCELLGLPRIGVLGQLGRLPVRVSPGARAQRQRHGAEQELDQLREWRPGESLRRVHWRTSARRERLVVREPRPRTLPTLDLFLLTSTGRTGPWSTRDAANASFERAVGLAATFLAHYVRRGWRVRLTLVAPRSAEAGQARRSTTLAGRAGLGRGLLELALVRPAPLASDQAERGGPWHDLARELGARRALQGAAVAILAGGGIDRSHAGVSQSGVRVFDVDDPSSELLFERGIGTQNPRRELQRS